MKINGFFGKVVLLVVILVASLGMQACEGTASGGGGGDGGGGGGGNGDQTVTKTFHFAGTDAGVTPQLYCGADGVPWEPVAFDQTGAAQITFHWLPQLVVCNVNLGVNKWAATQNGVCQNYKLTIDTTEITTWTANDGGGRNYSFSIAADGSVTLTGDAIPFIADCTGGSSSCANPVTKILQFSGYEAGQTPQVYCSGDGMAWTGHQVDANGQVSLAFCPADYACNVLVAAGDWAVTTTGVCDDRFFKVGSTDIDTWTPVNQWGGRNYSFKVNTDGSVTLTGSTITYSDCSNGGGSGCTNPVSKTLQFSGYEVGQHPQVYCAGDGMAWSVHALDANGQVTLDFCPADYICNVLVATDDWAVTTTGSCDDRNFKVGSTDINTWTPVNQWGGRNYSFKVNTDGSVTLTGSNITYYDCDGGGGGSCTTINKTLQFSGFISTQDPVIYCTGDGIGWTSFFPDGNGQVSASLCPGEYQCNVEVEPGDWAVTTTGSCDDRHFHVGTTDINTWTAINQWGGRNYSFRLNPDGSVTLNGSTITTYDCSNGGGGCSATFSKTVQFSGYTAGQSPVVYCTGEGMSWTGHTVNSSGQVSLTFCPGDYQCNVEVAAGDWAVTNTGACDDRYFTVGGTAITTWTPQNQYGGRNYSFRVNANGSVSLTGSNITYYDCDGGGGGGCSATFSKTVQFSGYTSGQSPAVYCTGDGMSWTGHTVNSSGQVSLTFCPGDYQCNVLVAAGDWAVTNIGACDDRYFTVGGTEVTTWTPQNQYGGRNYSFHVNTNGSVSLTGTNIVYYDCGGGGGGGCGTQKTLNFRFTGYTSGQSPVLYCSGGGLGWVSRTFDSNGQATLTACADIIQCNVEVSDDNWAVRDTGRCDDYDLKVNNVSITTGVSNNNGGRNYSFEVLTDGTIRMSGSTLNVVDCGGGGGGGGTCTLRFTYNGSYIDPVLHIVGGGLNWSTNYHFTNVGGVKTLTINGVKPDELTVNMNMYNSIWYVTSQGIMVGHYLYANDVFPDYWESNGQGGANLVFTLNDSCRVVIP